MTKKFSTPVISSLIKNANTKRTFKIMKLLVLFLAVGISLDYAGNSYSQTTTLSLKLNNKTVREVFNDIEKNSEYIFLYNRETLDTERVVSIRTKKETIDKVLDKLFEGTDNTYKVSDRQIYISKAERQQQEVIAEPEQQQKKTIRGTVIDQNGQSVIGANVIETGTTNGTVTDVNGHFILSVENNAIIQVSYIGFLEQKINVEGRNTFDITLLEDMQALDEIVVVGYGTMKKVNLTGAVESVGSEVFENRSLSNTTQALQGTIPNLNLSLEDGKPNRSASYNVRGKTSIGQGGNALVLIDGVEGDPSFLNPNDIESVSVLKDAASAAIYGARGSFGVVLITTKNPEKGKTTVNYSGSITSQSLAMKPEFVTDGVTWLEHFRTSYYNTQGTVPTSINNNMQYYSDEWLERMRAWKASGEGPKTVILPNGNYEYYDNFDWLGALYKDYTLVQNHNLTISGGTDKADFYISGRLYDFPGMYNFNSDKYKSYNLRAKGSLKATDWLRITNNSEFSNNSYHMPFTASGLGANINRYIEVSAFPTMPMYNPDGSYTRGAGYTLAGFELGNNYLNNNKNLFKNTIGMQTNFFNNTFRINGDFTFRYDDRDYFYKRVKVPYYQNANADSPSYIGDANGIIYEWLGHTMYTASNIYSEYENTFAQKHYLKVMAGWNYETSAYKANSIQRNQLLLESAESIQLATGSSIVPGASVTNWRTAGTFFRLNYSFMDRYLLEINGRYDGSSRFPVDQQWGFFPSISAGWRLSEEPFWNVNENIISDIKFRASYGSLGNGNISPYQFLELLSISTSNRVLDGNQNKSTSAPAPIPSGLTWEKATTTNIGVDFGMLNGKLRFNGDYYVRKTTDMYVPGPTLPDIFGASSPKGNYADMTTKGFELSLSWQSKVNVADKPLNFEIRGSLFDYVSVIDQYNNPTKRFTDYYDGMTIGELWGFKTDGLFLEDPKPEDYINTIFKVSADAVWRAGDLKIKNLDNSPDNMITKGDQTVDNPGDMTIIGNTEPRYQYSFKLGADWNGFFLSAFLQGVGKQDWYPGTESAFWGQYNRGYNQIPAWHLNNYWTEDNIDAYLPRYAQYNGAVAFSNYVPNDRYLQRVSYLRLKNLQFGYSLPLNWISKLRLSKVQVYISGENLASWSPLYKTAPNFMDVSTAIGNTDSDLNASYNQGAGNNYPLLKSYSFGVSVTY